jgi:hypothetical protein
MDCTRLHLPIPPPTLHLLRCPHCGGPLTLEDLKSGARLSEPVAHALIDHLILIETEMAHIRRLLVEEVMP